MSSFREKRRKRSKRRWNLRKKEEKLLHQIDTLPIELVGEIYQFLPLEIQNIIKPLDNVIEIQEFLIANYWVNFYLYFYEYFNHRDERTMNRLKMFFEKIKNVKYIKHGKKFFKMNDESLPSLLKDLAEIDVQQFLYSKEQHERNIQDRIVLSKSTNEIQFILDENTNNLGIL